ncbi:sensor histidine kinase [Streptomyces sp. NBC_01205]|uniref:sensor histidine kinase n=1 Tax=Streptomyces sp. NBC_01205 TaxID=2903771 RepID=UPI002E14342D|nr:sensor histidine kinase [Streptomyces sp. NBC_01205]
MPEDISLEGPQRRLNTATATAPEHKAAAPAPEPSAAEPGDNGQGWLLRILLGWHASFTLMGIVLELLLWTDGAPWFAHLVLYGLAASYVTLGAPALSGARPPRAGHLFLAIAYAGTLLLTTVDDRTPIALYLVLPTTFALLSPISLAVAACAGLTLLSDALYLGHHSFSAQAVGETALQNATTWLFAVLVGFFVTQLLTENRRRGDLIRLLEENRALLASAYHDAGVMAERHRLAQEIHDTVCQGLTSTLMLIRAADASAFRDPDRVRERLALAEKTVSENLAEVRAVVTATGPLHLGSTPLDTAIENITARLGDELGIEAEAHITGRPLPLDATLQVVLLRCAQEALANVRKHARADRVRVELGYHPKSVLLEITDDGRGFDAQQVQGFGLRGMRSRAEQVNGAVSVVSRPGEGTRVSVEVAWEH